MIKDYEGIAYEYFDTSTGKKIENIEDYEITKLSDLSSEVKKESDNVKEEKESSNEQEEKDSDDKQIVKTHVIPAYISPPFIPAFRVS